MAGMTVPDLCKTLSVRANGAALNRLGQDRACSRLVRP
jgi:hypothetical protein